MTRVKKGGSSRRGRKKVRISQQENLFLARHREIVPRDQHRGEALWKKKGACAEKFCFRGETPPARVKEVQTDKQGGA